MQSISTGDPSKLSRSLFNGDQRRHRRVQIPLGGRYMRPDRSEHTCRLKDISVGGAYVLTDQRAESGERIVAYFDNLGGIEGKVARPTHDGFALEFKITEHKREKLAAQLMWLLNRNDYSGAAGRNNQRFGTSAKRTTLRVDDGIILDVSLFDISVTGASIDTPARPPVGTPVLLAQIPAIIRRHHDKGLGIEFVTEQTPEAISAFL